MSKQKYIDPAYEVAGEICEQIEAGAKPRKWSERRLWTSLAALCATQHIGGVGLFACDYSPEILLIADEIARRHGPPDVLPAYA